MITHEEARKENNLMMENHITLTKEKYQFIAEEMVNRRTTHYKKIDDYITQNEQRDKNVARYLELQEKYEKAQFTFVKVSEMQEYFRLNQKLSNVGKVE